VKVQNFQNTENQSWGPGDRRPPEAPGIKHFINTFQSLS